MSVTIDQVLAAVNKLAQMQKDLMNEQKQLKDEIKQLQRAEDAEKNDTHRVMLLAEETNGDVKKLQNAVADVQRDVQKHLHATNMDDEVD